MMGELTPAETAYLLRLIEDMAGLTLDVIEGLPLDDRASRLRQRAIALRERAGGFREVMAA